MTIGSSTPVTKLYCAWDNCNFVVKHNTIYVHNSCKNESSGIRNLDGHTDGWTHRKPLFNDSGRYIGRWIKNRELINNVYLKSLIHLSEKDHWKLLVDSQRRQLMTNGRKTGKWFNFDWNKIFNEAISGVTKLRWNTINMNFNVSLHNTVLYFFILFTIIINVHESKGLHMLSCYVHNRQSDQWMFSVESQTLK